MFCFMRHAKKTYQDKHLNGREAESSSHTLSAHYGTDSCGVWDSRKHTR